MPFLIVHGHFYQPPRENPWTGIIEQQPGAAPFHDWNERVHAECYRPNAFVRIDEGLRFVILAPHQASRYRIPTRRDSERNNHSTCDWRDVNENTIDTSIPYSHFHSHDDSKSIAVFFYHGQSSRAIAFENLLRSSSEFVDALARSGSAKQMINVATDGETYGHHFKFGDLCLAHALYDEAPAHGFTISNYGQFLDEHPPAFEVEINNGTNGEGTSWSCLHGVGRWIRDCGCHTGGEAGWNQQWRTPLRQALDFLRDENTADFEATRGH